jgi:hypothetical protein
MAEALAMLAFFEQHRSGRMGAMGARGILSASPGNTSFWAGSIEPFDPAQPSLPRVGPVSSPGQTIDGCLVLCVVAALSPE